MSTQNYAQYGMYAFVIIALLILIYLRPDLTTICFDTMLLAIGHVLGWQVTPPGTVALPTQTVQATTVSTTTPAAPTPLHQ